MLSKQWKYGSFTGMLVVVLPAILTRPAVGQLHLGLEELVQADGTDVEVPGYSVPSFVHWDDNGLKDLIVGEGPVGSTGKVRVYLNVGTSSHPQFSTYFYAQSKGSDLAVLGGG